VGESGGYVRSRFVEQKRAAHEAAGVVGRQAKRGGEHGERTTEDRQ
jgi:hypothetical protein